MTIQMMNGRSNENVSSIFMIDDRTQTAKMGCEHEKKHGEAR